ncbi:Uncharacterized conserved protein, DUF305 family [Promicromonospora umidemergens]|uniref:DUF305 domain-containing protein n=1 Tax=Promicromonospora umidemergens TaxID=629679 RepID=A0ABP8Y2W9_9MICO|nr:DUF305 domain-containing protein [Promicromonospora umidemergens]MCP2286768.1 Uncharacterized conserved protein, DUF305 family [Promicromonospora umidemergens]
MKRTLMSAVVLAGALALAGCSGSQEPAEHDMSTMAGSESGDGAAHNEADMMFAQMMIPHHEQAVEMSDIVLAKDGTNPEVTALATQIKAAQAPEMEQLGQWLDSWGAERTAQEHDGHDAMSGMMTEEDMQALDSATPPESDRLFLEQMIAHHEGAVEMAQTEIKDGSDAAAVEMAQTIVDTQTAEIGTMEDLLASM